VTNLSRAAASNDLNADVEKDAENRRKKGFRQVAREKKQGLKITETFSAPIRFI